MNHQGYTDSRPPPPAYNRVVNKVTRGRNLRPVVLLCVILIFVWCLIVGIANIKAMNDDGVSGKLLASYIIQAALYLALCVLCLVGFWAAWVSKIKAGKAWVWTTYIGTVILLAAHVVHIALHFTFKRDITNACEVQERLDYPGSSTKEISDWCASDWRHDIWRQIAWMIFCLICAGLMIVLSRAFYHQLLDPNHGRTQQQGGPGSTHAYRMDGINQQQQTATQMPYGGPPPLANPFAPGNHDAVPDYNAPPVYVPPEKGSAYESFNAVQNERKDSMVDVRMDDGTSPHDRDLAGQTESLTQRKSNDSEDTIQGRRGEGRI